jgi:hypothetical protein
LARVLFPRELVESLENSHGILTKRALEIFHFTNAYFCYLHKLQDVFKSSSYRDGCWFTVTVHPKMKLRKFWKHQTVPAPSDQLAPVGDDKTVPVPNDKIVLVSDEVDDDVPMPNIFDMDGRLIDPNSPEGMPKPLLEGQEGPDSIFYVPSASTRKSPSASTRTSPSGLDLTIPNMLAQLSRQGVQPENLIMRTLVRPKDAEPHDLKRQAAKPNIPHFRMNYRVEDGQPPSCPYCKLILENAEDRKGFDLQELYEVAKSGCETCDVLQLAITYFARFVFLDFNRNRVWVKQSQNSPSMLLSETKMVEVHFEEHQDEVLTLSFKEVGRWNRESTI